MAYLVLSVTEWSAIVFLNVRHTRSLPYTIDPVVSITKNVLVDVLIDITFLLYDQGVVVFITYHLKNTSKSLERNHGMGTDPVTFDIITTT